MKKLTIGKAAQISGLSRYDFENTLVDHNTPISNLNFDDIIDDSKKLR